AARFPSNGGAWTAGEAPRAPGSGGLTTLAACARSFPWASSSPRPARSAASRALRGPAAGRRFPASSSGSSIRGRSTGSRAVCRGNLTRDRLDRDGELGRSAERWRHAVRALAAETRLVVNGDDPQVGDLARERPGALVFGLDDPRHAQPELQHAADSKYC